jgi:hypothetical protein
MPLLPENCITIYVTNETYPALPLDDSKERITLRLISTGQLRALLRFYLRPITWWTTRSLHLADPDLILESASRLDAFSVYQIRTWLPGSATGVTTGSLAVRPTRSSRTRVSAPQVCNAHSG